MDEKKGKKWVGYKDRGIEVNCSVFVDDIVILTELVEEEQNQIIQEEG